MTYSEAISETDPVVRRVRAIGLLGLLVIVVGLGTTVVNAAGLVRTTQCDGAAPRWMLPPDFHRGDCVVLRPDWEAWMPWNLPRWELNCVDECLTWDGPGQVATSPHGQDPPKHGMPAVGTPYRITAWCPEGFQVGDWLWRFEDVSRWPPRMDPDVITMPRDPAPGILTLSSPNYATFVAYSNHEDYPVVRFRQTNGKDWMCPGV